MGLSGLFSVIAIIPLQDVEIGRSSMLKTQRVPKLQDFISDFALDPSQAVESLGQHTTREVTPASLARLLHTLPELGKERLGQYLSEPAQKEILYEFVHRFDFCSIRLDQALRIFLLSVRLPADGVACERLLEAFVEGWYLANQTHTTLSLMLAKELLLSTIQLNDFLYPDASFGFGTPNLSMTCNEFINGFYVKDRSRQVGEDLLITIYSSIRSSPLAHSLPDDSFQNHAPSIAVNPDLSTVDACVKEWTEPIEVKISATDPDLSISLLGEGLEFDQPFLNFGHSSSNTFRIKAHAAGRKTVHFAREGSHA